MVQITQTKLYTWRGPGDNPIHIVRNQNDYIVTNWIFRNCIKRVTIYPGADIGSENNLDIADNKVKLKVIEK